MSWGTLITYERLIGLVVVIALGHYLINLSQERLRRRRRSRTENDPGETVRNHGSLDEF